jgi:hypothetical protein
LLVAGCLQSILEQARRPETAAVECTVMEVNI